jgi:tetratricopeptide (TPR) repeat protein
MRQIRSAPAGRRHDGWVIDPRSHWDFDDAAGSEQRLRAAAGAADGDDRAAWQTQVARALGLQGHHDAAHALLDEVAAGRHGGEVPARVALERGRLRRSAGDPDAARPDFEESARLAEEAGLQELQVDALHMVALVAPAEESLEAGQRALDVARAASDPRARDWDASLLNNMGMAHADAGEHVAALVCFEEALEARERIGDVGRIRVARWMVAWSLRHLGRTDEALALQRELRAELAADGAHDPYVDEEIALLEGGQG